jgi:hypothetical protein
MAIVSTFVLIFDLGIIRQTLPFRSRKKTAEAMVMAGGAVTARRRSLIGQQSRIKPV